MLWWGGISFHRNPLNRLFVIQYEAPGWLTADCTDCLPSVGDIETNHKLKQLD